jgi:1-hydroxycarotenoid 3,4-desaturase
MLIAHVERDGVWLVDGGMHRLAVALAELAAARGATLRYGAHVADILIQGGRASGVRLADGEQLAADAVVVNADVAAVAGGLFGVAASRGVAPVPPAGRSLSAMTWAMLAHTDGFPLVRHNVFFSDNYGAEFDDLFTRASLPADPTVYVCAQDRDDGAAPDPAAPHRLLCLVNAPPVGDARPLTATEIEQCETRMLSRLARCGLTVTGEPAKTLLTTPADFHRLFPATGGALYGQAVHGSMASFRRPGARSRLPGLFLAGGSTHPGAGVPMAALSGRLAATGVLADLTSPSVSRRTAMRGGTSTR